jgi:hypothetical protein
MFADDTQLFTKNDESVKKSFDIYIYMKKPLVQKSIMKRQKVPGNLTPCISLSPL